MNPKPNSTSSFPPELTPPELAKHEPVLAAPDRFRNWFIAFCVSLLVLIAFTCASHLDDFIAWVQRNQIKHGLKLSGPIDFPIDGTEMPMTIEVSQGQDQSTDSVIDDMRDAIRKIRARREQEKEIGK